jgi:hypothetical protein
MNLKNSHSIARLALLTLVAFLLIIYPVYAFFGWQTTKAVFFGYLLSLLNILLSYSSICWAFHRETKFFFAVVLGGMAVRFIVFALVLIYFLRYTQLPLPGFIISFITFYLFLQYYEVRFINRELRQKKF